MSQNLPPLPQEFNLHIVSVSCFLQAACVVCVALDAHRSNVGSLFVFFFRQVFCKCHTDLLEEAKSFGHIKHQANKTCCVRNILRSKGHQL